MVKLNEAPSTSWCWKKFDVLTEPGRTCWVFWGAFSEAWTSRRHWWTAPPPPQPCFDWSLRSSIGGPGFLFGSLLLLFEPQSLPGRYNLGQLKIKMTYYKIKKTTKCSKLPNEPVQCCQTLWAIWGTLAQATTRTEGLQQKTGEAWWVRNNSSSIKGVWQSLNDRCSKGKQIKRRLVRLHTKNWQVGGHLQSLPVPGDQL